MLQLHLHVLGCYLIHGQLLVIVLVRGSEVRNDLCRHLADVLLSVQILQPYKAKMFYFHISSEVLSVTLTIVLFHPRG